MCMAHFSIYSEGLKLKKKRDRGFRKGMKETGLEEEQRLLQKQKHITKEEYHFGRRVLSRKSCQVGTLECFSKATPGCRGA